MRELLGGADPTWSWPAWAAAPTPSGIFSGFADTDAELVGVEPAGGAAVGHGVPGVVHGIGLVPDAGRVRAGPEAESISAGLDYPGIGPEHAHLAAIGRARYEPVTDDEVLDAFELLSPHRGHHPRARVRPRPRLGERGPRRAGRQDRAGEPVGPRRQGRRAGRRDPGRRSMVDAATRWARSGTTCATARDAGRKLLVPYVTRWAAATTGST